MALIACPHGVVEMCHDIPGLVETSTNLASIKREENTIVVVTSQRSSVESAKEYVKLMVASTFKLAGRLPQRGLSGLDAKCQFADSCGHGRCLQAVVWRGSQSQGHSRRPRMRALLEEEPRARHDFVRSDAERRSLANRTKRNRIGRQVLGPAAGRSGSVIDVYGIKNVLGYVSRTFFCAQLLPCS